jgi:adenylosuccinate lyase
VVTAIHPMEAEIYKADYGAPEIRAIFDERSIVESWLLFEGILAEVQGELGIIPVEIAEEIKRKATLGHVKFERIVEIYRKTKHPPVATVRALSEICERGAGEYVHYGLCSPELTENTLAYSLKRVMDIFEADLATIRSDLNRLADLHRHTLMADRSHGQQALPTTFGFIAAIWSDAVSKQIDRFQEARKRVLMGTLKGVMGNHASYCMIAGEKCLELEKRVLERLGLYSNKISFRRHLERWIEFMNLLSLLAATFEKICDDIFIQQRSEIGEVEEHFDTESQIGSSTMPQKRNPVLCEAIIAWCRKIRSNTSAFSQAHMRESHDSIGFITEDLIIPETCVLSGAMLNAVKSLLENLVVKKDAMRRNLESSNGMIMAEALMLGLSKKTGKKQTAHAIVHQAAMEAFEKGVPFDKYILEYPSIRDHLTREEIQGLLKPENYLGLSDMCIDRVIQS